MGDVHDPAEWRANVDQRLTSLERGQDRIDARINLEMEARKKEHSENKDRLDRMDTALTGIPGDEENVGLVRKVDRLDSKVDAGFDRLLVAWQTSTLWAKVVVGILTLVFLAMGVWFASLEARHKVNATAPVQTSKQDAGEPAYDAHPEVTNAK
jgi:hypothetical protein